MLHFVQQDNDEEAAPLSSSLSLVARVSEHRQAGVGSAPPV